MISTLLEGKTRCAKFVGEGKSASDPVVVDTINKAIELLITEAHWQIRKSLLAKLRVRTYNKYLALPEWAESVLKIGSAYGAGDTFGQYYEFMDGGPGLCDMDYYQSTLSLKDEGDGWPTFFPIGNTARKIVAFSTEIRDVGKTMRVRGHDSLHMDIAPTNPGEEITIMRWKNGVEGTIDGNMLSQYLSTNEFADISSIVKPVTSGYVTLYAIDTTTDQMWLLGKYGPRETNPGYHRYRILGKSCQNEECVTMLVKVRYVPAYYDSDPLLIQSIPALQYMCRAIHQLDEGNINEGLAYQKYALRILSQAQSNANPPTNEIDVDMESSMVSPNTNLV